MSHEGGKPVIVGQSTGRRKIVRRLAAVLGADISGYSTLMAGNEEGTHRRVGSAMTRLAREIEKSYGRVFSFAGDGLMAEFPSAVEALKCALRVQVDASKRNVRLPREQHIEYRMGINSGEIVVQHERAGGTTVNIAARLEQIGEPGGIFISSTVFEQVNRIVATRYDLVGERQLKNIRQPIAVYRIAPRPVSLGRVCRRCLGKLLQTRRRAAATTARHSLFCHCARRRRTWWMPISPKAWLTTLSVCSVV